MANFLIEVSFRAEENYTQPSGRLVGPLATTYANRLAAALVSTRRDETYLVTLGLVEFGDSTDPNMPRGFA